MPNTYKLRDDPSKTSSLHIIICMKQNMLFELCVENYATFDGLVNGVNGIFKTSVFYHNKTKIWISFPNKKIGMLFREKSIHLYTKNIQLNWTLIAPIIKDIRIDKNQSRITTRIQITTLRTIHQSHKLLLNKLTFDRTNVLKHKLFYTTIF
jgi:hypothetical protein